MYRQASAGLGPFARERTPRDAPRNRVLLLLGVLGGSVTVLLGPAGLAGQAPPRVDSTPPMVLERVVRHRWVNEGQHPGFVPFEEAVDDIHVRSEHVGGAFSSRSLTLRLLTLSATLFLDERNAVESAYVDQPSVSYNRFENAEERLDARRRRLSGALPWARLWDVPFRVPPGALRPGLAWTDTLDLAAGPTEGLSQRLEGVRHSRVVGDTAIGGRRLPVVTTEADVRYRSTEIVADAAREGSFTIERDVRGIVRGIVTVDTALGVRAAGADSADWTGEALLRTPEGRVFPSGVRYERTRTWSLLDSAAWADSMSEAFRRGYRGMVSAPDNPTQKRLAAGDSAAIDSLLARWRYTTDPNERAEVRRTLLVWAGGAEGTDSLCAEMGRLRVEAGDSTGGLMPLAGYDAEPLTAARAARLLPYLDDPGRLWRAGIVPRSTYTELARILLGATPILQPDSSRWDCAPAACALLVSALASAHEPRLRDAALVGAFARDPQRWYARLRARADSGSRVVTRALETAEGVGAPWPTAPQDSMPSPGSDWRAWLSWMGGSVRFESTHRDALRMYAARTGRDPLDELRAGWPPEGDSARLVLGTILRGMGEASDVTAADLVEDVLSGSAARLDFATGVLRDRLMRDGSPAPPDVATELLSAVLDSLVAGGESPWRAVPAFSLGPGGRVLYSFAQQFSSLRGMPLFILAESLPEGLRQRLPADLQPVDSATWIARPPREGGVLVEIYPVRMVGDFVDLHWDWTAFQHRAPDESAVGEAGGGGLILVRTEEGWRLVARSAWIT